MTNIHMYIIVIYYNSFTVTTTIFTPNIFVCGKKYESIFIINFTRLFILFLWHFVFTEGALVVVISVVSKFPFFIIEVTRCLGHWYSHRSHSRLRLFDKLSFLSMSVRYLHTLTYFIWLSAYLSIKHIPTHTMSIHIVVYVCMNIYIQSMNCWECISRSWVFSLSHLLYFTGQFFNYMRICC